MLTLHDIGVICVASGAVLLLVVYLIWPHSFGRRDGDDNRKLDE